MSARIRRVECYDATVEDVPGEGFRVLSMLEQAGVNLLAFQAVPVGPGQTRISIFADDGAVLSRVAEAAGMRLDGPQPAFLVQGDDKLGALAEFHRRIYDVDVNVLASWGVADGRGGYGYIVYVRPDRYEEAARGLGL